MRPLRHSTKSDVFQVIALGTLSLALTSCAKFPNSQTIDSTRVIFTMDVRGQIRNDYLYYVAIRTSNDTNPTGDGPIPVVSFPNNNGFVAGNVNYFVRWTPDTQQYTLYRFTNSDNSFFAPSGIPINSLTVTPGSKRLQFELSLEQLVTTPGTSVNLNSIQVNFLTMNRLSDVSAGSSRIIDALGDTRIVTQLNQPVRILLATAGLYDNSRFGFLEPLDADTPDPDLDIMDWSIEVRRQ